MDESVFSKNMIRLENGFWEVQGLPGGKYDHQATKYDRLISRKGYNLLMWGNSPKDYSDFLKENLFIPEPGLIADIGCGSLGFTAKVYAEYDTPDLLLCDYSIEMLKIGKKRLEDLTNRESSVSFLRADALDMPLRDSVLHGVFSFGFLHVLNKPSVFLEECRRILKEGGQFHLTSLCTDRNISHRYLKLLHKRGHVATPLSSKEIYTLIENAGFIIIKQKVKGGMAYISAKKEI